VNVIETTPLSPTASLHIVKLGETYHVIASAAGTVSLLTEIEPPVVERFAAAQIGRHPRTQCTHRKRRAPGARARRNLLALENCQLRPPGSWVADAEVAARAC
jgi:flagellar biogenesis protein FliO